MPSYSKVGGGLGEPMTRANQRRSWLIGCGCVILALMAIAIAALALTLTDDAHWEGVNETHVVSRKDGADIEIRDGSNLILHDSIIDSFTYFVYQMITLAPAFGPEGPDLLFGDPGATYARLQAFTAIGFRVWDRVFIPIGGIFASNGLFGEDALAIVIADFANWIHGPIIGTGPAILIISDENAKENVKSLSAEVALHKVAGLDPRSFDYKGASSAGVKADLKAQMTGLHGFIAQEVAKSIPDAVHITTDYLPDDFDTDKFPPEALLDPFGILVEVVGALQAMWANGVITAGEFLIASGPPGNSNIAPCFNATRYPTGRDKGRCICEAQKCGQNSPPPPSPQCLAMMRACGGL